MEDWLVAILFEQVPHLRDMITNQINIIERDVGKVTRTLVSLSWADMKDL